MVSQSKMPCQFTGLFQWMLRHAFFWMWDVFWIVKFTARREQCGFTGDCAEKPPLSWNTPVSVLSSMNGSGITSMIRVLPLLLFFFVLTQALIASSASADDLTSLIKNHYAGMVSFRADFTQTLKHKESGSVETRKGTLLFAKPLRINWHTASPRSEDLIITKDSIWNYIPDEAIAYRYNPSLVRGANSIIQVITGQSDLMRNFDVKRVGLDGGLQRLKLYPKEPTTQLVEATIWVDSMSGIIRKSEGIDFYGNTNTILFTSYKENVSVKNSSFTFSPPKGVEVEDRRNDTKERDLLR